MPIAKDLLERCLALPPAERVELIEALGAALVPADEDFVIPTWHLVELERRVKDAEDNPTEEVSWGGLREELLRKLDAHQG